MGEKDWVWIGIVSLRKVGGGKAYKKLEKGDDVEMRWIIPGSTVEGGRSNRKRATGR